MKIALRIATLGPFGYIKGSGTAASLVTVPFIWLCKLYAPESIYVAVLGSLIVVSWIAIEKASRHFQRHDPSEIVIDEMVGIWITFCGITMHSSYTLVLGFLLFRFFDIVKPLGIKKLEYFRSPLGIIIDDVVAGLVANIILCIIGNR